MIQKPYEIYKEKVAAATTIGDASKSGLETFLTYDNPGSNYMRKWQEPPVIAKAKGKYVWDADGKQYLDCYTASTNIGHGDTRISEVIREVFMGLGHWFDFPTPERLKLNKRLQELTPGDFKKRIRLSLSNEDSLEMAIRAARNYTKKPMIITFHGDYHGTNVATAAVSGGCDVHKWYNPISSADHDIEFFPYAYCYRCPYGCEYPSCNMQCLKAMDMMMSSGQTSTGNYAGGVCNVAAMIVEPIQGKAGCIVPPKEFLQGLRAMADKFGFLLIFDETDCAMGRTGSLFASSGCGVVPDITVIGKAMGAGFPMSACIARKDIFEDAGPGYIVGAYAGYSMGSAIASKVFDIIEDDKLLENCQTVGAYLREKADAYLKEFDVVGNISSAGLYMGIEYVTDKASKTRNEALAASIAEAAKIAGVLVQYNQSNIIVLNPPLTFTIEDVDVLFDVLTRVTKALV